MGHGARALLRRGLAATRHASQALVEQGFRIFIDYYADHICGGTTLYPGVEAALDSLTDAGIATCICTNKPEALPHRLLDALGWTGRYRSVVCGDTLPVRKPDPAPLHEAIARAGGGRAAFVGVSIVDADTARAAQIPFVAVSFGFSDRPVEQLGADMVIDDYRELHLALARLQAV